MPLLWICLALVILLIAVMLIRTFRFVPAEAGEKRDPLRMPENPLAAAEKLSAVVRHLQSGYLYHYALVMIVGVVLFMSYFVWLAN